MERLSGPLLEAARPRVEFDQDWDDVLARARPARRPLRRAALVAACAAVLAAGAAAASSPGLRGGLLSIFDLARTADPAPTWKLAGPHIRATGALGSAARLTHVDPATIRRIASGGSGYRRLTLVGGLGPDREPWLAQVGPGWASDFFPLFGALTEVDRPVWHTRTAHGWDGWQFPMYGRSDSHRALFDYVAFGGSHPGAVDWATLVGFARSDVARVVVATRAGGRRALVVGRRGAYAYAAVRPSALPRSLTAYDATGHVVGRDTVSLPTAS
jgi:hypothetical protein